MKRGAHLPSLAYCTRCAYPETMRLRPRFWTAFENYEQFFRSCAHCRLCFYTVRRTRRLCSIFESRDMVRRTVSRTRHNCYPGIILLPTRSSSMACKFIRVSTITRARGIGNSLGPLSVCTSPVSAMPYFHRGSRFVR